MKGYELRKKVVDTAIRYIGYNESDGSHRKIVDKYNGHKPLAQGYKVTYENPWCATFGSMVAIESDCTDIIPTECSCIRQIELFKKMGSWQENDAYVPSIGDYVFYDWQDSGVGDNTGAPDHVGIVVAVSGLTLKIIEGNIKNAVGYRTLAVNARYIRGYGVPKYADKGTAPDTSVKVGCTVNFTGTQHYTSSNSANGRTCKPGKAKVTAVARTGKHPVHLVAVKGGGSNVYGWVDTAFVVRESVNLAIGARVKVKSGAKTYAGGQISPFVYKNTYDVIQITGDRVVIGVGKKVTAAVNKKDLTVV